MWLWLRPRGRATLWLEGIVTAAQPMVRLSSMKADPGSPKRHFRDDMCSACYHVMKKMAAERCDYEAIEDGIKLPQWKAGQLMRVAEKPNFLSWFGVASSAWALAGVPSGSVRKQN